MEKKYTSDNKYTWKNCYPWLALGAAFLLLAGLNLCYLENWLDSDMAAEMIFSKLLSEEGHLFATKSWFYSTEFRVLYTQLIMGPLFHITNNWHVIRAITNICFYLLMLLSYFYFMKPFQVEQNKKVLAGIVLLLPFSETEMLHMQMGNTYLSHVIILFFYFGLFLRVSNFSAKEGQRTEKNKAITQVANWGMFLVLGIICGMSGVRYILAVQAPLCLTGFLYWMKSERVQKLRRDICRDNGKQLCLQAFSGHRFRIFVYSIIGMLSMLAGYVINGSYISKTYSFQTYDVTNFIDIYQGVFLERVQDAFGSLIMLFGYIPGKSVLSLRGIISMAAFAMLVLLFVLVKKSLKTKPELHQFLVLFFLVSFFLNTFVFVFTNSTLVPRYYITSVMFLIPVAAIYFTEERIPGDRILMGVLLSICLLLGTAKTTLSLITTDKNAERYGAVSFLEENGYQKGYATYWNGNITQEISNGEIKVANISNPEEFQFFKWSSESSYYEPDFQQGRVFILLTAEEDGEYRNCQNLQQGERVYDDGAFVIYGYEDGTILTEKVMQ